jgi:hypothetical protein
MKKNYSSLCVAILLLLTLTQARLVPTLLSLSLSSSGITLDSKSAANVACSDGICKLPSRDAATNSSIYNKDASNPIGPLEELQKMGWGAEDAKRVLVSCNNDALAAATMLEEEQEAKDILELAAKHVFNAGWSEHAASVAVNATAGNVTAALEMLEAEEKAIVDNFEASVADMVYHSPMFFANAFKSFLLLI